MKILPPGPDRAHAGLRRRRVLATQVAALAAGTALALTGCGGSPTPTASGSASSPGSSATGTTGSAGPGGGAGSGSASASGPGSGPAATATPSCSNASKLAGWSDRRLAMLTIAVPASESAPGNVSSEVAAGAGGVLLFGNDAPTDLGAQLAALRTNVPGRLGLLVMTDEEGGGIQRMANLVGSLPWPAWMGSHWSEAQIQQAVYNVGRKMAAAGVNMDLAPVVDVDGRNEPPSASNPDGWRSFSGDPAVVARDGVAYLKGLRSAGVIPVLKHFPGLGGASYNTDLGPAHTLPWPTLQKVGLPPFTAAIAAGAPAVMMSNASVPGLADNPGGLSPTQVGVLRKQLGFHGLVITDALDARAISAAGYDVPAAAVQALRSGADMVMFGLGPNVSSQTSAIASAVTSAVSSGHLTRARLVEAAGAVLAVRGVNLCSG